MKRKINWDKELESIPKGWTMQRIEDIFDVTAGGDIDKKLVSKTKTQEFNVPIYANSLKEKGLYGYTTDAKIYDETITVTARGELGYAVPRYEPYYPIVRLLVLKPKKPCDVYFFSEIINSTRFFIEASGVPQLTAPQIRTYRVPVPPFLEQKKIASILSTWDEAIELYKKNEKLLELRFKGVIQRIFENQSDWKEYRLDEIAEIYQPKTLSAKNMAGGEYRVFGANGYIGYHNEYNHEQSQVTVSCRGENTGAVNLVEGKTWITGNSMVLNVDVNSNLNKKFLYFYLKNQNLKYLVTGSGQPQIIRRDIAKHRIKLPSSNKQEEIVEFLDVLEKEIELTKKLIVQLQEQKRGLMQLLLTGKVRV